MPEVERTGYRGWWEVKLARGKDKDGNIVSREAFRNMVTGDLHVPENGWDGEPPYPTGDLANCRHVSDKYRAGYDRINWHRPCSDSETLRVRADDTQD